MSLDRDNAPKNRFFFAFVPVPAARRSTFGRRQQFSEKKFRIRVRSFFFAAKFFFFFDISRDVRDGAAEIRHRRQFSHARSQKTLAGFIFLITFEENNSIQSGHTNVPELPEIPLAVISIVHKYCMNIHLH